MNAHTSSSAGTMTGAADTPKIGQTRTEQDAVTQGRCREHQSDETRRASEVSLHSFTVPHRDGQWRDSRRRRSSTKVRATATELASGGSGGNDGGGENGRRRAPSTPDPIKDAARAIRTQAARVEPRVTDDLLGLQAIIGGNVDGAGVWEGRTYHLLNARLKTEESLARKIAADVANDDLTIEQASGMIFDALRYTYILDESSYGGAIRVAIDALITRGYMPVRAKNFWASNAGYAGINTVWRTETGQAFEVQFHTQRSLDVKEGAHRLYEHLRETSVGTTEFVKLSEEIVSAWRTIRDDPPQLRELSEWLPTRFP